MAGSRKKPGTPVREAEAQRVDELVERHLEAAKRDPLKLKRSDPAVLDDTLVETDLFGHLAPAGRKSSGE